MEKRERVYVIALAEDLRGQMIVDDRMEGEKSSFEEKLPVRDLARQQPQVLSLLQHRRVEGFFHGA